MKVCFGCSFLSLLLITHRISVCYYFSGEILGDFEFELFEIDKDGVLVTKKYKGEQH